jgi:hypothetical protein
LPKGRGSSRSFIVERACLLCKAGRGRASRAAAFRARQMLLSHFDASGSVARQQAAVKSQCRGGRCRRVGYCAATPDGGSALPRPSARSTGAWDLTSDSLLHLAELNRTAALTVRLRFSAYSVRNPLMKLFSLLAFPLSAALALSAWGFAGPGDSAQSCCQAGAAACCGCEVCKCPDCDGQSCSCDVCECVGCACAH